tara:strand:+ start:127 stop:2721 length:2595 start_codon:yes stop_codon:yes gene_type:complete
MGFSRSAPLTGGGTISGDLTITGDLTVSGGGSLTFDETVSGNMIIDNDYTATTSATERVLYVDFDKSGVTASGQTANLTGLSLQLNDGATNHASGTVNMTGLDLDVVSTSNQGTTTNVGLNVNVSGSDTNYPALFSGGNIGIGTSTPDSEVHIVGSHEDGDVDFRIDNSAHDAGDSDFAETITISSVLYGNDGNAKGGSLIKTGKEQFWSGTTSTFDAYMSFSTLQNNSYNERMRITSSGKVGIGTTPQATWDTYDAVQIGGTGALMSTAGSPSAGQYTILASNNYWDGSNNKSLVNDEASRYKLVNGTHEFDVAAAVATSGTQTFTTAMTILNNGTIGMGTASPLATFHVKHTTDDTDENGNIAMTVGGDASGELRHYWGVNNSSNYGYYGVVEHATAYRPLVLQPNGSYVGIGVTDPDSELEIYHATDPQIKLSIDTHGDAGIMLGDADGLKLYGKGTSNQLRLYSGASTLQAQIDANGITFNGVVDITDNTDASNDSGDTGALRCEGGASIAKKLYVGGTTSLEGNTTISSITTMQYETNQMVLTRAGGHLLTLLNASDTIADGNSLGYLRFNGNENSSGEVVGGEISVNAEGAWTNNTDCPTKMSFYTNPGDGMTEYMRLTKDGNLLLNDSILSIYSDDYVGSNYEVITMSKADGGSGFIKVYKGSSGTYRDLEFQTGGSTRLTIASGGAVTVAGALSKGSGSFKIDHPLESKKDTHHLVHSFVEAPQADNIYRGKVNLSKGTATINIDEVAGMTDGTFVALNREVQCFTSNESDWDAVKGSVSGNILTISCQNENSTATISWLVIGERQDKHMMDTDWTDKDGKVIVEPLKPEEKSTDHVEGKDPLDGVGNLAPNQRPE